MTVRPISGALAGEHVLVVAPHPAFPSVDAAWSRRLRLFTGRALDAGALTAEQDARGAKLAILGQTRSAGIASGLEIALEPDGSAGPGHLLHISPGFGILPSGEDVVLGHELRIAPAAFGTLDPALRAAILIAVPVTTRIAGEFDAEDPCERDDSEDAFADEQRVDGLQIELVPWDPAWGVLDAKSGTRNALAYRIFETERTLAFGELAPWQVRGLPLGLVGLAAGAIAYVDRHAVARRGGDPTVRAPLVAAPTPLPGSPALWQARILQLADHAADLRGADGTLPNAVTAGLVTLPPAGMVPRDAVDFIAPFTNRFFPATWRLRATALPSEQLGGVLARAAALAPLSTASSEEVMVIVPVPQAVYEPHLLETEVVSPEFQAAIDQLVVERTDWLGRRLYARGRRDALLAAGDPATVVAYPSPDPDQLEDEGAITAISAGEDAFDVQADGSVLRSSALFALNGRIAANPSLSDVDRGGLFTRGLVGYIADLQSRISQADDAIDFGFLRGQSDIYRLRQLMLGNQLGTKLATSPALASIAKGDTATTVRADLTSLYTTLKSSPPPPTRPPIVTSSSTAVVAATGTPPAAIARATVFTRQIELPESTARLRVGQALGITAAPAAPAAELRLGSAGLSIATTATELGLARTFDGSSVLTAAGVLGPSQPGDIRESSAIIGASEFRNVTVAERVEPAPSSEARQYAVSSRFEGLQSMSALDALGFKVDDIPVYAVPTASGRQDLPFSAVKALPGGINAVLSDQPPAGAEEAVFFHDAVNLVEAHIGMLRGLEGRVAQYRAVLQDCQATLVAVQASLARVDARIAQDEHEIADRRHAIATARALLAEEIARVARINARRAAVIAQQVGYLAYVRPRFFEGVVAQPELGLDPALLGSPVPACLGGHDDAPSEIAEMIALLREAPLTWLRLGPPILSTLDRIELVHGLVVTARARAQAISATGFQTPFVLQQLSGRFGASISAVGRAQVDAIWQPRAQVANFDLRALVGLSWTESRDTAQYVVSLGDLIEGDHRRSTAQAQAQAVLSNIEKVAGCVWAQVGQVLPAIRLAWAEALDQYDTGNHVVTLNALPRWREVPSTTRQTLEQLAEWLIEQIDRTIPAAVSWMHDLVRACILLASFAPVDQIISGSVATASPAGPGQLVPVAIDPARVRIGMRVQFFSGANTVAHGIVEDLIGDRARARIAEATTPELRLDAGTRARFAMAGTPAAPLTRESA